MTLKMVIKNRKYDGIKVVYLDIGAVMLVFFFNFSPFVILKMSHSFNFNGEVVNPGI